MLVPGLLNTAADRERVSEIARPRDQRRSPELLQTHGPRRKRAGQVDNPSKATSKDFKVMSPNCVQCGGSKLCVVLLLDRVFRLIYLRL